MKEQQQQVQHIQTRLPALSDALDNVASAEAECNAANVEENDYTVFTCQDLEFELELVVQSIVKKIAFIDNQVRLLISQTNMCSNFHENPQIVSRNMTNLTPAQLEQFESTFRYFDKDESNTLSLTEMTAALASLGIVYSDVDMDYIYTQLTEDYGAVTFEAFINLLVTIFIPFTSPVGSIDLTSQVDITEDQTSPEQLRESFRGIAADKVCCIAARRLC